MVKAIAEERGVKMPSFFGYMAWSVCVLLPLRGVSALSVPGGPFHDPAADAALFDSIRAGCGTDVEVEEHDCDINDPAFAEAMAERLCCMLEAKK